MFFKSKTEKEFVREIINTDKDFWKSNKTREDAWSSIKKKVLKFKTNDIDYPFITELKLEAKKVIGPNDIENFMKKVYEYDQNN